MKTLNATTSAAGNAETDAHLLDTIRAFRANVGDGLNDDEFTRFLQKAGLQAESGFEFLSYSDRFVTLSVPGQEMAKWYPEKGWISVAKERIVRAIAEKHKLLLCQPPDLVFPWVGLPNLHHHLELSDGRETVIMIHPLYLKVRLFVTAGAILNARAAQRPLLMGDDLMQDLAALYGA